MQNEGGEGARGEQLSFFHGGMERSALCYLRLAGTKEQRRTDWKAGADMAGIWLGMGKGITNGGEQDGTLFISS